MLLRKGYENSIMFNKHNEFLGLCLGSDFTAEHEYGIKGIAGGFGFHHKLFNDNYIGVDKTTPEKIPEGKLHYFSRGKSPVRHYLIFDPDIFREDLVDSGHLKYELMLNKDHEEFSSAWSDSMFAVMFEGKHNNKYIDEIYKAFLNKNICFLFSSKLNNNPFARRGLCLVIKDRIDEETINELIEDDLDQITLKNEVEKLKIDEFLRENDCKYLALSPRWCNERKQKETEFPIMFWLNPLEQTYYNSGWYTVEELMMWPENKGPIPKNN